ncbi:MAG TPA: M56 family metallopeptidase, partial [Vicinamibacterales bacterium]|nr:M56 family metallopeptidase [Vicinamibacterales bacterium]
MRILDLSVSSGAAWLPVVDAIAKATIVLATAGVLTVVLRRASAASRHLIWTLALLSALALPVFSLALPKWQVGLVKLRAELPAASSQVPATSFQLRAPSLNSGPARVASPAPQSTPGGPIANPPAASKPRFSFDEVTAGPATVFAIWLLGACAILARLVLGVVAVQWMSRRTERVKDAPWLPQARALASELGISPRITFLRSGRAAMPMAWGVFRPAVLMPADADNWPAERLRIVLLHELAHVKRRDCLTHLLAQVACAAYWFNPLAWIAARHVRTERERACDDLVLAFGTRGSDYADQLIEVARVMRSGRFPVVLAGASLAMAHRSQLEGRLMAILDPSVPRTGVSRLRTAVATAVFAVAVVLPLASVQPWTVTAAETPASLGAVIPAAPTSPAAQDPEPRPAAQATVVTQSQPVVVGHEEQHTTVHMHEIGRSVAEGIAQGIAEGVPSGILDGVSQTIADSVAAGVDGAMAHWAHAQHSAAAATQAKADPRTVAALTAALKDTDKDVRETALHALVQLRDPSVFDPLVQALS